MPNRFAQGKKAFGFCDLCSQRYPLAKLQPQIIKQKVTNSLRCRECIDADHPQLMLGTFPIDDPQALRNPRPDPALQESRDIQWGWNPVGGGNSLISGNTPNTLVSVGAVGSVTVATS